MRGIAVVGSDIFVARDGVANIEIYDSNNFCFTRQLKIGYSTFNLPTRLALDMHQNCLYVSTYDADKEESVLRQVKLGCTHTDWSVEGA